MSIAIKLIQVFEKPSKTEFEEIVSHVSSHHFCQNMHLRDTRQVKGKRTLRFLHMVKMVGPKIVGGHISGPLDLELDYEMSFANGICQYTIKAYSGPEKDLIRISKALKKWLLRRVSIEQEISEDPKVRYTKGEFYLRRSQIGMGISHQNIQAGLKKKAFSSNFAKKVGPWGFEVLHP